MAAQNRGGWKQSLSSKEGSVKEMVAVFDPPHVGCIHVDSVEVKQRRGDEGEGEDIPLSLLPN